MLRSKAIASATLRLSLCVHWGASCALSACSLWAVGVRSALLILCLPSGVPLAYFAGL
ncbi:hypothetical protein [Klebsiella phage Kpn13]|uniref:Lipoprotein n=1 Tax=Klebsiella phage Kpn13 TaxID=3044024 RepID=A0AAT9V682_9CAUD|nr:hypothetical protein [Klebsiella phage Kpn13]